MSKIAMKIWRVDDNGVVQESFTATLLQTGSVNANGITYSEKAVKKLIEELKTGKVRSVVKFKSGD